MKQLILGCLLISIFVISGCSKNSDELKSKNSDHLKSKLAKNYIKLGEGLRKFASIAECGCYFEPSTNSLVRLNLKALPTDISRGYLLVTNYPSNGQVSEFYILNSMVSLRTVHHSPQTSSYMSSIRQKWSLNEFQTHFKDSDIRFHPNTDLVEYFETPNLIPNLDSVSGKLTFNLQNNDERDFYEISLDKGIVVAVKISSRKGLD